MRRQLAIETATQVCSVSLQCDDQIYSRLETTPRMHAQKLLPNIEDLLNEAGCCLSQLDHIVISVGPGSFVGLRIGVGVMQGLAFAHDIPVKAVSTLAGIAQTSYRTRHIQQSIVAMDAKMSELYFGQYSLNADGVMQADNHDQLIKPEDFKMPHGEWSVLGDAWKNYPELKQRAPLMHAVTDIYPEAEDLFPLAETVTAQAVENVLPVYLRTEKAWKKMA